MKGPVLLLLAMTACAPDEPNTPDAGTYIAFASDFASYESWPKTFRMDGAADAEAPNADAGCSVIHNFQVERDLYMNQAPPHGATEFPCGTMLVKEQRDDSNPADWHVYAMVKRGGGFNAGSGCDGWEWFELDDSTSTSSPQISWRGPGPPPNAQYGGCNTCVTCHAASGNDCVQSDKLQLSSF